MALQDRITQTLRFGNFSLISGFYQWTGWRELRQVMTNRHYRSSGVLLMLSGRIFSWFVELFALPLRLLFRVRQGRAAFGSIVWLSTVLLVLLYNNEHTLKAILDWYSAIGISFWGLISSYDVNWTDIGQRLWNPQSISLTVHFVLVVVSGLVQLIGMNVSEKYRDTDNPFQKGTNTLYLFFHQHIKLSRDYYHVFFEPALALLVGFLFMYVFEDRLYGSFLIVASLSLFGQEFLDYVARKMHEK